MVKLSVLDLALISEGNTVRETLDNTVQFAQCVEESGYTRFWLGEHHFIASVSSAPTILLGHIAEKTSRIQLGSGAIQTGPVAPATVVEQFGTLAELYPGRIEIGLGRSIDKYLGSLKFLDNYDAHAPLPEVPTVEMREIEGVYFPEPIQERQKFISPVMAQSVVATYPPGVHGHKFIDFVQEVQGLIRGPYPYRADVALQAVPGAYTQLPLWIMGSSAGESATVAAACGLPFVVSYHFDPSRVLEAVQAYRSAFEPGVIKEPYVMVSADIAVGENEEHAKWLARTAAPWYLSILQGKGAGTLLSPDKAPVLEGYEYSVVETRLISRFVGTADTVAEKLHSLAKATQAQEIIATSLIYDNTARMDGYRALARSWSL